MGLGNPGELYATTRHNLGFLVVDRMAYKLGISYIPGKGKWWEASGKIGNEMLFFMKPTTYMNNSGLAVIDFLEQKNIQKENMIVILDDADLPIGKIKRIVDIMIDPNWINFKDRLLAIYKRGVKRS